MVEENLRQNRPSKDGEFVNGVRSGLRDVYAGWTEASLIDGDRGRLFYRGYSVESLAEHSSFEEVCYLMFYGTLPTRVQLEEFDADLKSGRHVRASTLSMLRSMTGMQPIDALRTVVSAMSGSDSESADNSHQGAVRKGIRITASAATILAAHSRMSKGEDPVAPDEKLGHTANFLYMLLGKVPDGNDGRALDKALILHAEHGANASSFAARTVASTGADLFSAITAALAALKGPKHGGAAEGVIRMAEEIGSAERAAGYVKAVLDRGGRVPGFGHPVYRTADPRADCLEAGGQKGGGSQGQANLVFDLGSRGKGDGAILQGRHWAERRPVVGCNLPPAWDSGGDVQRGVCDRSTPWVDRARDGAGSLGRSAASAIALRRPCGSGLCAHKGARVIVTRPSVVGLPHAYASVGPTSTRIAPTLA